MSKYTAHKTSSDPPGINKSQHTFLIRTGTVNDLKFLEDMLYQAILWNQPENPPSKEELFSNPVLSALLADWPNRSGDFALIAENTKGLSLGGAWYRFWPEDNPGFGYIDEETPELGIAVIAPERGKGIGTWLLRDIIREARHRGIKKISLSVDPANPARRLYERTGFCKAGESGTSWTMVANLV